MITSKDNPQIKELKKLQEKRFRVRRGLFAAEGEDLVTAALAAGWQPEAIYCAPDAPAELLEHTRALEVEPGLLLTASALGSGTRVIGVFAHDSQPDGGSTTEPALSLHLHGVADPGNVGTLIRSAQAFADGPVSLGEGCADPFSPKALRAAMGATFEKPPIEGMPSREGVKVVALDADGEVDIRDYQPSGPVILLAGGERKGLSELTLLDADVVARIPMRGDGPESLNVAMATTIALYELGAKLQTSVHGGQSSGAAGGNVPPAEN